MANYKNPMNIIEALVQLRNDLKLWVTNNLRTKVDKVEGMGLSTNDFTNAYKDKLDNMSEGSGSGGSSIQIITWEADD